MKILVTGAGGQLGYDVLKVLEQRGHSVVPIDLPEIDITDKVSVQTFIYDSKVDAVIHCAAFTAVDAAEDESQLCTAINVYGTGYIAETCKLLDIPMLYISTDYVFNGMGTRPWEPEDKPQPLNIYGNTKYEGECLIRSLLQKYFIIRTSWVFGLNGKNFVKTMLKIAKEQDSVNVVNDQIGSPTYTADLAVLIVDMIESDRYGIYHASNSGYCTWYEFAMEIFRLSEVQIQIKPISSDKFKTRALRPKNSRMNQNKLKQNGFNELPDWHDALKRFIDELIKEGYIYG